MATPRKLIKLDETSVLDDPKYDIALQHVFGWLTIAERYKMREVCKRWKDINERPWIGMTRLNCYHSWSKSRTCITEITLSRLGEVLNLCGHYLTHLDFSGDYPAISSKPINFYADVKFFSILAAHCPKLKILNIYILTPTPEGITHMANKYNRITDFRIFDYESTCNKALSLFFKKAQNLEAITLHNYDRKDNCLLDLPVETIKHIHLDDLFDETANQLVSVLRKCRDLESFSIGACSLENYKLSDVTKALSQNADSLKQLNLSEDKFAFKSSHFAEFKNLEILKLSGSMKLNDEILQTIGKNCRKLKSVMLIAERVTDCGIKALPNLEHIDLRILPIKGQFLAEMSNLKTVSLSHCSVTDRYLHLLLDTAVNLQYLELRSFDYHNIKELVLHALDVTNERKTRIPLEIILDVNGKIKESRRGLLHVRNA